MIREPLANWIERQYRASVPALLRSVSPLDVVKTRPGFGQTMHARRGAIVASPVLADWDPEPDYFFHWYRDSAVVVDALRLLAGDGGLTPETARAHLSDFVDFSLALGCLEGARTVRDPARTLAVTPAFQQYLRPVDELESVHGDAVAADTRVNPDGTLDISRWARPQHDGPALRALVLLRWMQQAPLDPDLYARCAQLVERDLGFLERNATRPCYDIWEEEQGLHYYTLRISAAALAAAADWLRGRGGQDRADALEALANAWLVQLDGYWLDEAQHYRSRGALASGERSKKELDIAVILAAVHAGDPAARHGFADSRLHATLAQLEALFAARYPINHGRRTGFAMGRYDGDVYHAGGAYHFSTFGAAEFCYRVSQVVPDAAAWRERGDATLDTVREYVGEDGALAEQFDQRDGTPRSARHLAWSYAAFLSCRAARAAALDDAAGR